MLLHLGRALTLGVCVALCFLQNVRNLVTSFVPPPRIAAKVKPGNSEIVEPLMALFQRHPALLSRVAVIMSFDLYVLEEIADRFAIGNMGRLGTIAEGGAQGGAQRSTTRAARMSRSGQMRSFRGRSFRNLNNRQSVSYGAVDGPPGKDGPAVPKLLLLTAWVEYDDYDGYVIASVKDDFKGIAKVLLADNGIDGVYLEYEPGERIPPRGLLRFSTDAAAPADRSRVTRASSPAFSKRCSNPRAGRGCSGSPSRTPSACGC